MVDPVRVTIRVFLLCSGSGDAYTASAFLGQAEAEEAAALMVATLLAKSPDAIDLRTWRHELSALNRLYRRIGQPQQHLSIVSDELQVGPAVIVKVDGLSWLQRLFWRWVCNGAARRPAGLAKNSVSPPDQDSAAVRALRSNLETNIAPPKSFAAKACPSLAAGALAGVLRRLCPQTHVAQWRMWL